MPMLTKPLRTTIVGLFVLVAAMAVAPPSAHADQGDVPAGLTQTGRMFDAIGRPVSGNRTIVFAIYDAPTGGAALWTESHDVAFDDGYFVVALGETTALPGFDGAPVYLGLKVAADPEMTPREELLSVPYAMVAGDVVGDINGRRGRIEGMENAMGGITIVNAHVPLAEMFGYATDLRSRTQGRATYTMQFHSYQEVPDSIAKEIVARVRGE